MGAGNAGLSAGGAAGGVGGGAHAAASGTAPPGNVLGLMAHVQFMNTVGQGNMGVPEAPYLALCLCGNHSGCNACMPTCLIAYS